LAILSCFRDVKGILKEGFVVINPIGYKNVHHWLRIFPAGRVLDDLIQIKLIIYYLNVLQGYLFVSLETD